MAQNSQAIVALLQDWRQVQDAETLTAVVPNPEKFLVSRKEEKEEELVGLRAALAAACDAYEKAKQQFGENHPTTLAWLAVKSELAIEVNNCEVLLIVLCNIGIITG